MPAGRARIPRALARASLSRPILRAPATRECSEPSEPAGNGTPVSAVGGRVDRAALRKRGGLGVRTLGCGALRTRCRQNRQGAPHPRRGQRRPDRLRERRSQAAVTSGWRWREWPPARRSSAPAVCDAAAHERRDAARGRRQRGRLPSGHPRRWLEHHRATRMARSELRRARGAVRSAAGLVAGHRREALGRLMAITVHTTMATWLVEVATGGELRSDPGWAAR